MITGGLITITYIYRVKKCTQFPGARKTRWAYAILREIKVWIVAGDTPRLVILSQAVRYFQQCDIFRNGNTARQKKTVGKTQMSEINKCAGTQ